MIDHDWFRQLSQMINDHIENGKVVDGLGYIPRERAVEMYRQYKATGKIRMS